MQNNTLMSGLNIQWECHVIALKLSNWKSSKDILASRKGATLRHPASRVENTYSVVQNEPWCSTIRMCNAQLTQRHAHGPFSLRFFKSPIIFKDPAFVNFFLNQWLCQGNIRFSRVPVGIIAASGTSWSASRSLIGIHVDFGMLWWNPVTTPSIREGNNVWSRSCINLLNASRISRCIGWWSRICQSKRTPCWSKNSINRSLNICAMSSVKGGEGWSLCEKYTSSFLSSFKSKMRWIEPNLYKGISRCLDLHVLADSNQEGSKGLPHPHS